MLFSQRSILLCKRGQDLHAVCMLSGEMSCHISFSFQSHISSHYPHSCYHLKWYYSVSINAVMFLFMISFCFWINIRTHCTAKSQYHFTKLQYTIHTQLILSVQSIILFRDFNIDLETLCLKITFQWLWFLVNITRKKALIKHTQSQRKLFIISAQSLTLKIKFYITFNSTVIFTQCLRKIYHQGFTFFVTEEY